MRIGVEPLLGLGDADQARAARACAARAASRLRPLCRISASSICRSIVCSGLSEVIGSWKIIAMRLPRTAQQLARRRADQLAGRGSGSLPGGMPGHRVGQQLQDRQRGHRLARAGFADQRQGLAALDRRSRRRCTACDGVGAGAEGRPTGRAPRAAASAIGSSPGTLRGSKASRTASPTKISRVSMMREHDEAGDGRARAPAGCSCPAQQLAERGRAGRQAEAEEVERGQRGHRAGQDEGQEGQRRHHRVGQDVAEHDARRPSTPSARAART